MAKVPASYQEPNASRFSETDAELMARALSLAKQGECSTTPNPMVGCVIADAQSHILAEGWHQKAGEPHAEVDALSKLGPQCDLSKATAYVTLEPCSHFGKTGPCAQALIDADVKRVIIACLDPNPLVSGRGVKMLEDAGVEVQHGLLEASAKKLNTAFLHRMNTQRPYVMLKLAASLDGKTALANGESKWITGEAARRDVQAERARSCAILSGSGTVLADNPRLNVRSDELHADLQAQFARRGQQPLRVIVDGNNQLHQDLSIIKDGEPTLVYNKAVSSEIVAKSLEQVQIKRITNERHLDLGRILDDLGKRGINRLWVEAGAKLAGALVDAKLVDELIVYIAPKLLGGGARELLSGALKQDLSQADALSLIEVKQLGNDLKLRYGFGAD